MTSSVVNSTAEQSLDDPRTISLGDTTQRDAPVMHRDRRSDDVATILTTDNLQGWTLSNLIASIETSRTPMGFYWTDANERLFQYLPTWSPQRSSRSFPKTPTLLYPDNHTTVLVDAESVLQEDVRPTAEAATKVDRHKSNLEEDIVDIFNALFVDSSDEVFVDGIETTFGRNVGHVIRAYGDVAVRSLHTVMSCPQTNVEVVEEALRRIGSLDDMRTHHSRLAVLVRELESPNPRIRDAASIGIADMDDPAAIESLCRAIDNEQSSRLQRNLQLVLSQLQATKCRPS